MANLTGTGSTGLPPYYIGRYLTLASILGLTQNADGTFAKGTSGDLCTAKTVEFVRFMSDTTKEEISPANLTVENEVIIKNRFTVEVGEIRLANMANNISVSAYGAYDYYLVTAMTSPDGGTTKNYVQAIISRSSLGDEYAVGKGVVALTGSCAGINIAVSSATPTWT